ncbi:hypothetical protein ABPG74_004081 [Tetrahymena malaccensis]
MGDWDEDWESADIKIEQAQNQFAKEDAVDTLALEKKAKEEAKQKAEEEARKKKEEEEAKAAKNKKKGPQKIVYTDQFNMPDNSKKLTQLKEEKRKKQDINDMFDGANHEFNEHLQNIELQEAEDFEILGQLLGNKLCDPDYLNIHIEDFFKNLLESTYEKLSSKELQEILSKTTVLLQQKQREEKGNAKTNSKKGKGPNIGAKNVAKYKQKGSESEDNDDDDDDNYNYKANFNEDDFI